ncbi:hypothetical protein BDA99DRAFT_531712 [Phascolomyces articulosus]|uniref:BZIP domain-containing protein n=1 Tax=Phascolomyces articulosus TaxID=60185 RepID=A0AAD5PL01_9FUNG|nr:hypothetical protein BDA99DRAFT_531712 [Phascolomyces articulosus]
MSYQPDVCTVLSSSLNELKPPPVEQNQVEHHQQKRHHHHHHHQQQQQQQQQQKRKIRSRKYMDDDEKRKQFLERNRQAALKCRQRKKQWLNDLQAKAEYLMADNEQLQIHVYALHDEIINLQSLLYAHRDCPMIKQMPPSPAPRQSTSNYNFSVFNGMITPMVEAKVPPDVLPDN